MDHLNESRSDSRRKRKARQRRRARRERRQAMVKLQNESLSTLKDMAPTGIWSVLKQLWQMLGDAIWHLRHRTPALKIGGGVLLLALAGFAITLLTSPTIGPGVQTLGTGLSGLTPDEAEAEILRTWHNDILIDVYLEGQSFADVRPAELGLSVDAAAMADAAKSAGLSGFPFGYTVEPVIKSDYGDAQTYMLSIVDSVYIPPYEAGYEWQNDELIGMEGQPSRELDVTGSAALIVDAPQTLLETRRLNLLTTSRPPTVIDPAPYLAEAYDFVTGDFALIGYDPFSDEEELWATTREEMAKWLAAGENGLVLREAALERLLDAINQRLRSEDTPRYLDEDEAKATVRAAIRSGDSNAALRIRYMPDTYTLESGDWGYVISRKTGMPFRHIQDANPNLDWESLTIGQVINLPSRDLVIPEEPVRDKRIVVDLDRLWLVAYENGEVAYSWPISSGRRDAPTYPGVYQILSKTEKAYGSTFDLCGANGCGQWEMNWFMGIYEVAPGLTNGFHGAVLLPNGAYLDGGAVQARTTYGCVMSEDPQAEQLYNWAEIGTIVEIISSEYPPQSNLGEQAMGYIDRVSVPGSAEVVRGLVPAPDVLLRQTS
jgi:LysM repeat protein